MTITKINATLLERMFEAVHLEESSLDQASQNAVVERCSKYFEKLMDALPKDASEDEHGAVLAQTMLDIFCAGMEYYAEFNTDVSETPEFVMDLTGEDEPGMLVRLDQDLIEKLVRFALKQISA